MEEFVPTYCVVMGRTGSLIFVWTIGGFLFLSREAVTMKYMFEQRLTSQLKFFVQNILKPVLQCKSLQSVVVCNIPVQAYEYINSKSQLEILTRNFWKYIINYRKYFLWEVIYLFQNSEGDQHHRAYWSRVSFHPEFV